MKKRGRFQSGCGTQRPNRGRPRAARAALLVPNRQRQGGGKRAGSRCRDGAGAGKLSRQSDALRRTSFSASTPPCLRSALDGARMHPDVGSVLHELGQRASRQEQVCHQCVDDGVCWHCSLQQTPGVVRFYPGQHNKSLAVRVPRRGTCGIPVPHAAC